MSRYTRRPCPLCAGQYVATETPRPPFDRTGACQMGSRKVLFFFFDSSYNPDRSQRFNVIYLILPASCPGSGGAFGRPPNIREWFGKCLDGAAGRVLSS